MLKKTTKKKKTEETKSKSKKAEPAVESDTEEQASGNSGLPLFFSQPKALDKEQHAKAGIKQIEDYSFATATNSIPLNTIEFIEAAKYYPIVFTTDELPSPAAVVGLQQKNYFVASDGSWKASTYIPAYVRQYPFVFFEQKEEDKFYLCIDEASQAFQAVADEDALPLFKEDGEPSDITNNALEFCTAFYNHHNITKNFCEDLKKHDLLVPYHSQATLPSGEQLNLAGFTIVDEQRFNALSDEVILEFRKKGWLAFIYLALASSSNWKNLADIATPQDQPTAKKKSSINSV